MGTLIASRPLGIKSHLSDEDGLLLRLRGMNALRRRLSGQPMARQIKIVRDHRGHDRRRDDRGDERRILVFVDDRPKSAEIVPNLRPETISSAVCMASLCGDPNRRVMG